MAFPSTPEIDAARRDVRWANGYAGLGSIAAILGGLALRDVAAYAFSWEHGWSEWITFGVLAFLALGAFGLSLGHSWRVYARTRAVVAAVWWVGIMGVVLISYTIDAIMHAR